MRKYKYLSKVYYAIFLLVLIIFTGTLGFMIVEAWTFLESFYMAIITISTVGFQEVHELSTAGQVFTAFLIIISFGTFAYAVSAIASNIVGSGYKTYFREYRTQK